jgi:MFS family permease
MTQRSPGSGNVDANQAPLDWLNFFLADVRDGLGPFLAIFLMTSQHWDSGRIGLVLTIAGVVTVLARAPAGALIDAVRWQRGLIALGAVVVALATIAMALAPGFWVVATGQAVTGVADAVFPSAVAAISLGIFGRRRLSSRIGRNEAFNHAGNVVTAILAGLGGWLLDPSAVLWIIAALAAASVVSVFRIQATAIEHDAARGADDGQEAEVNGLGALADNRPFLIFTAAITSFHFANAAMLPLLGKKLSEGNQQTSSLFMASCVVTAQIVMVPMAILVGRKADVWGRKPLFLAGFAVLPIRGLLYTLTQSPIALVSIQVLDGVGAGIFGALFFIMVADLTKGSGRYNLAQGASAACWGLGAALGNAIAGFIVNAFGYSAAFLFLAGCALGALVLFWLGVPETLDHRRLEHAEPRAAIVPTGDA